MTDFGVLRRNGRFCEDFKIINKTPGSLFWQINQFKLEGVKKPPFRFNQIQNGNNLRNESGIIEREENVALQTYQFDARALGVKCFILEVEGRKTEPANSAKEYILVLGDIKQPELSVRTARFQNAILAIPGKIYISQKVSANVILTNTGPVETFFIWGNLFGCHCRKIKVEIFPKKGLIKKDEKLMIRIDVTALDEGIVSHCYIPCFFCRSKYPLILSVVALNEKLNVTFEIIDYPNQTHADASTFLKSPFYHTVLRIPWPVKTYNPTLNLSHISEKAATDMLCMCSETEAEANRAFSQGEDKIELQDTAKRLPSTNRSSNERMSKIRFTFRRTSKSMSDEDFKGSCSSAEKNKSEENSLLAYSSRASTNEYIQFWKPQLDFSDTSYRTPVLRQFAIRNETPLQTKFKIRARHYGVSTNLPPKQIKDIKRKVFGSNNDEYQDKLQKNQPLVLIIEPSEGDLAAFEAVCISVIAYGNTWGEYRDSLLCEIKGIETFDLKLFVRIVGHPVHFPGIISQSSSKPILRFQPRSCVSGPISTQIKVVNRSALSLTIAWIVFLIDPLPEEDREESSNSYVQSFANVESNHSGGNSTKSSKNYIPKNASDSGLPFRNMLEARDFSDSGTLESLAKTDSSLEKKEKSEISGEEKCFSIPTLNEEEKSQVQRLSFPGRLDNHIFQVDPKEIFFEPFEEKKMTITFNPGVHVTKNYSQEYKGVLTGCVKLRPEDERCPGIYYRPCGVNFVSELMDFNALVETSFVSFKLLKGDLKFIMDANAILKSPSKKQTLSKKFLIKNNSQTLVSMKIEITSGVIFKINSVKTLGKHYPEYNPEKHLLKIDSGQLIEVELLCTVSCEDVMYSYAQLLQKKNKRRRSLLSGNVGDSCESKKEKKGAGKEPWRQFFNTFSGEKFQHRRCRTEPRDSMEINLNRLSFKSDNSICYDGSRDLEEYEGECYVLWDEETPAEEKAPHVSIVEEKVNFVQPGLVTQTLTAELHVSFPLIKLSSNSFDFGNVYIGESAVRYFSLINLTGFPTDFRIKAKSNNSDFSLNPITGILPPSNYNLDIGVTITIEFRPSEPCFSKQTFHVYCNLDFEFDFYEFYVAGFGSWNEKYRRPRFETYTKFKTVGQT